MVGDIRKYVQHISLSPDSIQNDEVSAGARGRGRDCVCWEQGRGAGSARPEHPCLQAVAPLMKYLDEKLALLNSSLVKGNLSRCGRVGSDGLARGH